MISINWICEVVSDCIKRVVLPYVLYGLIVCALFFNIYLEYNFLYIGDLSIKDFYLQYGIIFIIVMGGGCTAIAYAYKKTSYEIKTKKVLAIFLLFSTIMNLEILGLTHMPFVMGDEIGYWQHAATLCGFDWSVVGERTPWYGFGYSLLLWPIMYFIEDTVLMYKLAVVVNVFMLSLSYFFYRAWLKTYCMQRFIVDLLPLVAVFYPAYSVQVGITWSETCLTFIFSIILYIAARIYNFPKYSTLIMFAVCVAYLYMVHNRTIGVSVSAVIYIIMLWRKKKLSLQKMIAFFMTLISLIATSLLLKKYFIYREHANNLINGFSDSFDKLLSVFYTFDKLDVFFSVLSTQSLGIAIATCFLVPLAIVGMIKKIMKGKEYRDNVFLLLSFCATLLISAVWFVSFDRYDHLIYTRYIDFIVGPMLILGVYYLMYMTDRSIYVYLLSILSICAILSVAFSGFFATVPNKVFNIACSPVLDVLYELYGAKLSGYLWYPTTVFVLLIVIKKHHDNGHFCVATVSVLCLIFTGMRYAGLANIASGQKAYNGFENVAQYKIYVPKDRDFATDTTIMRLQYVFRNKKIYAYDKEVFKEMNNAYLMIPKDKWLVEYWSPIVEKKGSALLLKLDKDDKSLKCIDVPLDLMHAPNGKISSNEGIRSENNLVCYGPYVSLLPGKYRLIINCQFDMQRNMDVATIEITADKGRTHIGHTFIREECTEMEFTLNERVDNVEFVVKLIRPLQDPLVIRSIQIERVFTR